MHIPEIELSTYYRDNITVTLFPYFEHFLKLIKENPSITTNQLKAKLGISNGAIASRIKDGKLLKLFENGYGKRITILGEKWLSECNEKTHLPTPETIKEACLNVPLFNLFFKASPENTSSSVIFNFFISKSDNVTLVDKKFVQMGVKRYLEGMYGMQTSRRGKTRQKIEQKDIVISSGQRKLKLRMIKQIEYNGEIISKTIEEDEDTILQCMSKDEIIALYKKK